jgi:uncharacterized protein (DUF952 family)
MIYHIVPRADWEAATGFEDYRGDSLEAEGFIHCSTKVQVLDVAKHWFPGRDDLLLLKIDPARLSAQVLYEDGGNGMLFPHVYGPIEKQAVVAVADFLRRLDGQFEWPSTI